MRRLYSNALSERPSCSSFTDAVAMKVLVEAVSGALRSRTLWLQMSAASPFHPPCRLFFVTFALLKESERSLRSELKPGYGLKSSQITDSARVVLVPWLHTVVSCADCSSLIKSVICFDCWYWEHQHKLLYCVLGSADWQQCSEYKVIMGMC